MALMSLARTSVEQVVGVAAFGLRAMICSMGEFRERSFSQLLVDAVPLGAPAI
jgi:hypothetical protein